MRYFKENSIAEKALSAIERILIDNDMSIELGSGRLYILIGDNKCFIRNIGMEQDSSSLPRMVEEEKIMIEE